MAFATGLINDPAKVGAGELYGNSNIVLSASTFESALVVGRFAKLDTGSIDNIDASSTPTIAGVVLRNVAASVEAGSTIDATLTKSVEYVRQGLVTVDVPSGVTPTAFGAVYVENQTSGQYGKATTVSSGNVAADAEFIQSVATNVWLIRLK